MCHVANTNLILSGDRLPASVKWFIFGWLPAVWGLNTINNWEGKTASIRTHWSFCRNLPRKSIIIVILQHLAYPYAFYNKRLQTLFKDHFERSKATCSYTVRLNMLIKLTYKKNQYILSHGRKLTSDCCKKETIHIWTPLVACRRISVWLKVGLLFDVVCFAWSPSSLYCWCSR